MPFQLFERGTYEPLPTNMSVAGSRRSSQRRPLLAILFLVLSAGLIWLAIKIFSHTSPYSPLDNYQNM